MLTVTQAGRRGGGGGGGEKKLHKYFRLFSLLEVPRFRVPFIPTMCESGTG